MLPVRTCTIGVPMTASNDSTQDTGGRPSPELGDLVARHRDRLRRMVRLRLDPRLNGRVDASDVIQDAYVEATRRYTSRDQQISEFVWLRFLTGQKLAQLHRYHLGAQARNAGREVSINGHGSPEASSAELAAQLVGRFSSPSHAANRAELRQRLQQLLNEMDETDREILALRHFEQLDNSEAAEVLGIEKQAAYKRYIRAVRRLKKVLQSDQEEPHS